MTGLNCAIKMGQRIKPSVQRRLMTVRQFSTLTASSFSVVAILNVAVPAIAESLEITTEAQFDRRVVVPGKGKEGQVSPVQKLANQFIKILVECYRSRGIKTNKFITK